MEATKKDATAVAMSWKKKDKDNPGLIAGIENPVILARCMEQLELLKSLVRKRGLDSDTDLAILDEVFGDGNRLSFKYALRESMITTDLPEWAHRHRPDGLTPEESKAELAESAQKERKENAAIFINDLEKELDELKKRARIKDNVTAPKQKLEELCRNVPEAPRLDRLLRYEASLERAFDRTLAQLERLQRLRLGLPAPHRVELQATVSQG